MYISLLICIYSQHSYNYCPTNHHYNHCLKETNAHKTPGLSLLRTFVMMLGEVDFIPTFVDPYTDYLDHTMHFPTLSFTFLVIFVLLMPILLMNLLVSICVMCRCMLGRVYDFQSGPTFCNENTMWLPFFGLFYLCDSTISLHFHRWSAVKNSFIHSIHPNKIKLISYFLFFIFLL